MKCRFLGITFVSVLACCFLAPNSVILRCTAQAAEESWRGEFDDISTSASDAMALSVPELEKLLARCATLKKTIDKLEESPRKVYGKRLQMTNDLLQFMLDSKKAQTPAPAATPPAQ